MTWEPGPKNLITDVPGILVGNSDDSVLKSGVSVLTSLNPMTASYSVMGVRQEPEKLICWSRTRQFME